MTAYDKLTPSTTLRNLTCLALIVDMRSRTFGFFLPLLLHVIVLYNAAVCRTTLATFMAVIFLDNIMS
jgi:hypothetical protein